MSHLIMITIEENSLPSKISLYGNVINVRTRPFIDPVNHALIA